MATYGQAVRRGLPRVTGGEPWPRAGEAPASLVGAEGAGAEEAAPAERASSTPQDVTFEAPERAAEVAAPAGTATSIPQEVILEAPDAAARVVRRGLPRVPGGEPWPPASAGALAVPTAALSGSTPPDAGRAPAAAAGTIAATAGTATTTTAAPQSQAGTVDSAGPLAADATLVAPADGGRALRRGLPRVPGGDPWPPAGIAPAQRDADAVSPQETTADAGRDAAALAPIAASAAAPAETPTLAPPVAPAAVAATATAAAATPVATAATPVAPSSSSATAAPATAPAGPRPPLPFTRTVWPGASAAQRPAARPEPARIGPFTRTQWAGAVIVGGFGLLFAAAMAVLAVRWFISLDGVRDFLAIYPGEYHLPEGAPVGMPAWLGWQHFFNVFLMVLIIRSGLQVRGEKRPSVFWSPRGNSKRKISLALWLHQALDILWIVNGVIFVVLLFVTGQWMKIVPTSWEVFPNAISAALQYVSLDWPTENGWVNYNSLQQLAYFATVFIAAPLAIITGVRMSGIWPKDAKTLNRIYPVEWARAVHFPVMIYFVLFIFAHVVLVFATGALRNLNHMYAGQDAVNWTGFWIFAASMLVVAAGWVAARPLVLAPIAGLFGTVKGR